MTWVVGLDLSLRRTAWLAVPLSWRRDWGQIVTGVIEPGASAREVERLATIWTSIEPLRELVDTSDAYAYVESAAFNKYRSHAVGELHGIVKLALYQDGFDVRIANMTQARKLLLGHVPATGKAKSEVVAAWKAAGAPFVPDNDLCDAMTCANWGLSELGGLCFAATPIPLKGKVQCSG
jgi:Holliday junction resolvasome RuvABC endonuclease subunit